jgi:CubicO group peptidase (beta-lactamase class C family)
MNQFRLFYPIISSLSVLLTTGCESIEVGTAFEGHAGATATQGGSGGTLPTLSHVGSTTNSGGNAALPLSTAQSTGGRKSTNTLADYLGHSSYPDDFWKATSFAESRTNPKPFEQALQRIADRGWEIHSFLVALNGKLLFERYGYNEGTNPDAPATPHSIIPTERHPLWSTTKSFTSALVGIAIGEGKISGVDHRVVDWFADYAELNPSDDKSDITLEDLLTMRSGLQFTEGQTGIFDTSDPARAALSQTMLHPPASTWNYSSGNAEITAEILRVTTNQTPLEYAKTKLFDPIGITNPPWESGPTGLEHGGFGLSMTPREMARFGELYRNFGRWGTTQVIPYDWTTTSTLAHTTSSWGMDYGYFWFVPNLEDFFVSIGMYGQQIYVSRKHGLVIVFTGYLPSAEANSNYQSLIVDYILPAVK